MTSQEDPVRRKVHSKCMGDHPTEKDYCHKKRSMMVYKVITYTHSCANSIMLVKTQK